MARYSRRTGPASAFDIPATLTVIPGLTITRNCGAGPLLILATAAFQNSTGFPQITTHQLFLDGVALAQTLRDITVLNDMGMNLSIATIEPIAAGIHTIDWRVSGAVGAGDTIRANQAELMMIQLPHWDQDDDVT